MAVELHELERAYIALLKIDPASMARHHAHFAMIVLRELICERTGRTAEDVQTSCEAIAAKAHIDAR